MNENSYKYLWRCAKCSNHLASMIMMEGNVRIEKKCTKCKSLNILNLANKEISIHCKFFDQKTNGYIEDVDENYPYPLTER